jgi:crotonobetainyl-CoA:carnitine CoA-transferase CaiB-like acyl-CoA transferase
VPDQSFRAADDWIAVAAGNDGQFRALVGALDRAALADDPRFATNPARVEHREALIPLLAEAIGGWAAADLLAALEAAGVPCAPINTIEGVFADPQVAALGAVIEAEHPTVGALPLVRWPFELSETPAELRRPPPLLGEQTEEILKELGLGEGEIEALRGDGAI